MSRWKYLWALLKEMVGGKSVVLPKLKGFWSLLGPFIVALLLPQLQGIPRLEWLTIPHSLWVAGLFLLAWVLFRGFEASFHLGGASASEPLTEMRELIRSWIEAADRIEVSEWRLQHRLFESWERHVRSALNTGYPKAGYAFEHKGGPTPQSQLVAKRQYLSGFSKNIHERDLQPSFVASENHFEFQDGKRRAIAHELAVRANQATQNERGYQQELAVLWRNEVQEFLDWAIGGQPLLSLETHTLKQFFAHAHFLLSKLNEDVFHRQIEIRPEAMAGDEEPERKARWAKLRKREKVRA